MSEFTAAVANQPFWMVLSIVLMLLLVFVMGLVTWNYDLRRSRLPQATAYEDLGQKLVSLEANLAEKGAELQEIRRQIQDRDRIAAEVAALADQRDSLRLEIDSLGEGARQVEEMKGKAAEVAAAYALESGRLEQARTEIEAAERLKTKLEDDIAELRRKTEALPQKQEELKGEIDRLQQEKLALDDALATLRPERGMLLAAREEAAELAVRKAQSQQELEAIQQEIEPLQGERSALHDELRALRPEQGLLFATREEMTELARRKTQVEREIEELQKRLTQLPEAHVALMKEVEELRGAKLQLGEELSGLWRELLPAREEAAGMAARKAALHHELEALKQHLASCRDSSEFAQYETERMERERELLGLQQRVMAAERAAGQIQELEARKAALEVDIARSRGAAEGGQADENELEDLKRLPLCLSPMAGGVRAAQRESEALNDVALHLQKLNLKYNKRTIWAFHTALKINDVSQMTVLAGVSGTGKSLLPRRYAEAMGLRFLQIAVEPRWDSPQDLLGFYNYVEKRYRATDLARALVHMDPFGTSGLIDKPLGDQMLLVLLDEMNLARVEYYFSEFLSRLEVRPPYQDPKDEKDEKRRQDACMPIDIRGQQQRAVRLFPSHNVLFAGTMNDDESTQALSDKVLDRSNVMQFAAPTQFAKPAKTENVLVNPEYRRFDEWRTWIQPVDALSGSQRDTAQIAIGRLSDIMTRFGRPFGHRLNEAILTYVANYPRDKNDTIDFPLADQIEFRILPKLRGVTIEDHQPEFDELANLIRGDLKDQDFANTLEEAIDSQRKRSGQFSWRGFDRSEKG